MRVYYNILYTLETVGVVAVGEDPCSARWGWLSHRPPHSKIILPCAIVI